jgi:RNA polymerase subunit RPABC4/transcription elongation factor Spt4
MAGSSEPPIVLCKQCKREIPSAARICSTCNSYQDWRSLIPVSNTALALLTALVSVIGIAAPAVYKVVHKPRSEAMITMPSVDGTTLRVVAVNRGDAPASLIRAWVDSEYLAAATRVRLRNDSDAIIQPGSKLLAFDIVPLLDEDDSYRSSMEMLTYVTQNKRAPRTEIRFHVFQSDGSFAVQKISLDAGQLFSLLRANADRCSAIQTINFENGCVGRGTPPEERFPKTSDKIPKGLVDELEIRINRQQEIAAKNQ